jgi:ATP-dependent RNA helicase DDX5/DBP2
MLRNLVLLGRQQLSLRIHLQHARFFSKEFIAGWPEGIKKFLLQERIEKPTLIQERTLPIAMENKNLVGIARTGSGKTLAFVIPAVMKVLKAREEPSATQENFEQNEGFRHSRHSKKATCLVLAPTRELATQTSNVFQKFRQLGLNTISLVGGSSRNEQMRQLQRESADVYVATPGRLMDLIDSGLVDLSHIKYLVLDEADRMLDMGFEPQIRRIIQCIPKERQTLMWSATWPHEIQSLASEFLENYEYVAVDSENLKANPNISQLVEICEPHDKLRTMLDHMKAFKEECETPRVLIFVNTKRLADSLLIQLMRNRIKAISIHGDRTQNQRDNALRLFRDRLCHVLVATDVAARGLDINDITHVINFDFPNTIEDYIHRIGRTARHDRKGTALTLFTVKDVSMASKLVKVLRETNQEVPEKLEDLSKNQRHYRTDARDLGHRRLSRRQDFYAGRTTSRFSDNSRSPRSDAFPKDRFAIFDEDDDQYDSRRYNRSDQNQERGRYRASSVFDD